MTAATALSRPLENKVAIVTGASSGIGAASARALAIAGAAVVLASRSESELEKLANEIDAGGGKASPVPTDVTDEAAVNALVEQALTVYGRLDVAFNNAGQVHQPTPLSELAVEDFDRVLAANVRGVFLAMKYEIVAMLEKGAGAIVNMSSTAGLRGVRGIAGYATAKHAIVGLTKSAALDYADRDIRINAIAPGPILSGRLEALDDETRSTIAAHVPLGRIGRVDEVASTVVWLLSDQASLLTGATIPVDGGRLAGGG
jgi:NAD(P)-dependent dehydrogenase (short-subunit alcohol dehydrogenase family)